MAPPRAEAVSGTATGTATTTATGPATGPATTATTTATHAATATATATGAARDTATATGAATATATEDRSGAVAILLAAGSGTRMGGDRPKAFLTLGGRTLLTMASEAACGSSAIESLVVAVPSGWERRAAALLPPGLPSTVVVGGDTRHASVRVALRAVDERVATVVCHDAARALCSPELFDAVIGGLSGEAAGVVPVVPVPDTVKRVDGEWVSETLSRERLALAQTPQAFRRAALADAHERAAGAGLEFTDDAALLEWAGLRVRTVPGDPRNIKVTTAADLDRAADILRSEAAG